MEDLTKIDQNNPTVNIKIYKAVSELDKKADYLVS